MQNLIRIFSGLMLVTVLATGCDTFLDVESDRLVFPDDHNLNSPNDTIYSIIGIFSKLEKLADRYVLLGELRGDLMRVTENANPDLREIYNFEISQDNPYNQIEDYYAVINNCNYLIRNIDTSFIAKGENILMKEFAAAKAIRAWTYMQLAFNYGNAKYYEDPVLSIKHADNYKEYSIEELIPFLIEDLEPWKDVETPGSISLGEDLSSERSFFPIRFLLGDLYLWSGEYEKAAIEYHRLMVNNAYVVDDLYASTWTVSNGVFVSRAPQDQLWWDMFELSASEQITLIAGSTEFGKSAELIDLSWDRYEIAPSSLAIANWDNQTYYYNTSVFTKGDLRGEQGSYENFESNNIPGETGDQTFNLITKFYLAEGTTSKAITVYRKRLLYLRYAEAVNRTGKPNLAFAVLKNGLKPSTLLVDSIVPISEKFISYYADTNRITFFPFQYVNFWYYDFEDNIGIHAGGCGNVMLATDFIIPPRNSLHDSILYVEDKIIEELALETAFEGNRFHDLMRVSFRRNDPSYLYDRVAEKYTDNKEAIRSILMDENNWYLPDHR